jgi:NCAIR mutase (PurE)-related protein
VAVFIACDSTAKIAGMDPRAAARHDPLPLDAACLAELIGELERGEIDPAAAAARLRPLTVPRTAQMDDASVDLDRRRRCGFPEVVFCQGKSADAVVAIFEALQTHGEDCLGTRVSPEQTLRLLERFPQARHNPVARTVSIRNEGGAAVAGRVPVITAGTSDRPVAEEALETLHWMRCETELIVDVGVAGPHRLPEQLHRAAGADAIIVVAGMEGALPSVVGGLVDCPVVVNIDAGFKAGYVAGLIARRRHDGKPGSAA